ASHSRRLDSPQRLLHAHRRRQSNRQAQSPLGLLPRRRSPSPPPPVDPEVFVKAKEEGRRKPTTDRTSKKCGCLFKFEVIETAKDSDVWVLHYPNEEHKVHNHGPSTDTSDPRARKLPDFVSAEVDQWLREGRLVSQIQEELRRRGYVNVLNTDLYNRKRLLKKGEGNGLQQQGGGSSQGGGQGQQQIMG
ncbi:hypothetical protein B0T21DRAFT_421847, partial [Apiosordaria backusii]